MKAILEFDLPDDSTEYVIASNANNLYCALSDIHNKLRTMYKYESDSFTPEQITLLETIRNSIVEILDDNDIPSELRY